MAGTEDKLEKAPRECSKEKREKNELIINFKERVLYIVDRKKKKAKIQTKRFQVPISN